MTDLFLERSLAFLLFWGIWILAPLVIDFTTAMVYILMVTFYPENKPEKLQTDYLPMVSVVIPVHDSSATLYQCLQSITRQEYPAEKLQIICVNNGSSDNSFAVFSQFQNDYHDILMNWITMDEPGKSFALNAGIYMIKGDYVFNIDSDAWLDKKAILTMVEAFENDPHLAAATGAIHIDKKLGENTRIIDVLHYCEEIEYLVAFNIGRRYQSVTNNLFTLAGAFSAFRREVLLQSFLYSERTVSEDTDLTFHIRKFALKNNLRLTCVSSAIAYVEPISSLSRLYSQRVRWQRGQLEVTALHSHNDGFLKSITSFYGRTLVVDHTLAFSRLTWTFLIPFLYFLGYPLTLVFAAFIGLYFCYLLLDFLYYIVAVKETSGDYRKGIKKIWWVVFFLPLFRFITYWFRFSGLLLTLTEQSTWKVQNPVEQLKEAVKKSFHFTSRS